MDFPVFLWPNGQPLEVIVGGIVGATVLSIAIASQVVSTEKRDATWVWLGWRVEYRGGRMVGGGWLNGYATKVGKDSKGPSFLVLY